MLSSRYLDAKVVESIPSEILRTLPGAQSPPGTEPNFAHPQTRVPVILGIGSTFLFLALSCFTLRVYMKLIILKSLKLDDITISIGFLLSIVYYVVTVIGCVNGAAGKHQWEVHLDKVLNNPNLYQSYITTIMVTPALGLIKLSLFIQYFLLFKVVRYVRISVFIGASLSAIFYGAITIIGFVLTSPWPGESIVDAILSWHYLKFADFSIATGIIGLLVDCILLVLPLPAIWQLRLPVTTKIGVMLIFMTGGLATAASMASLYYRIVLQNDPSDSIWKVSYVLLWSQVEMFAGVTASSMPTVRQFFARHNLLPKTCTYYLEPKLKSINLFSKLSTSKKPPKIDLTFIKWRRGGTDRDEENELSLNSKESMKIESSPIST